MGTCKNSQSTFSRETLRIKWDLNPSRDLVSVLEIGLGVPNAQFSMENYEES